MLSMSNIINAITTHANWPSIEWVNYGEPSLKRFNPTIAMTSSIQCRTCVPSLRAFAFFFCSCVCVCVWYLYASMPWSLSSYLSSTFDDYDCWQCFCFPSTIDEEEEEDWKKLPHSNQWWWWWCLPCVYECECTTTKCVWQIGEQQYILDHAITNAPHCRVLSWPTDQYVGIGWLWLGTQPERHTQKRM